MIDVDDLRERVVAEYARLGLPGWPSPRPVGDPPRDEEYSRVTDPDRYRIVHARARVWTAVLEEMAGARSEPWEELPTRVESGIRLTSPRPGTLPMLLLEGAGAPTWLQISAVEPSWVLDQQPDCGCDACDSGSDDLLGAIDDTIAAFVAGPYVLMRGAGWHSAWHPGGGQAGGTSMEWDFHDLMERSRRMAAGETVELPPGTQVVVNRSWLG